MNPIELAQSAAYGAVKALAGGVVTYTRSAGGSVDLTAVPASTTFETVDERGTIVRAKSVDWLILVDDLAIDSVEFSPSSGDTISETIAGVTYVYEVLDLGPDRSHRVSNHGRIAWRIHSKLVSEA